MAGIVALSTLRSRRQAGWSRLDGQMGGDHARGVTASPCPVSHPGCAIEQLDRRPNRSLLTTRSCCPVLTAHCCCARSRVGPRCDDAARPRGPRRRPARSERRALASERQQRCALASERQQQRCQPCLTRWSRARGLRERSSSRLGAPTAGWSSHAPPQASTYGRCSP